MEQILHRQKHCLAAIFLTLSLAHMKIKRTLVKGVLAVGLCVGASAWGYAQSSLGRQVQTSDKGIRRETLSGIDVFPGAKEKGFLLSFQQELKEDAVLHFTDPTGKISFAKALPAGDYTYSRPMKLGLLNPGEYLVEVKTSHITYWKKVRVRY